VVTRELRLKEMLCRSIVHLCYCIVLDLSRYPLHILQMTPGPKMIFLKLDAKHNHQLTSHPRTAHHYQPSIDIAKKIILYCLICNMHLVYIHIRHNTEEALVTLLIN
jgi:hypothetical protein